MSGNPRDAWGEGRPGGRRDAGVTPKKKQLADEWWARTSAEEKVFFRDLARLLLAVKPDEVLEVRYKGNGFEPIVRARGRPPQVARLDDKYMNLDPEKWWRGLVWEVREFFRRAALFLPHACGDRVLELRKTQHGVHAALVRKLEPPEPRGENPETN